MKKNFFQIILGTLAIALGFNSCEKEKTCIKCINFKDKDFGMTEICANDQYIQTQQKLDQLTLELKSEGYIIKYSEKCN